MPELLNIINTLTCGGIFLLAFLIYSRRHEANKGANLWLAIFLFMLGILYLDDAFTYYKIYYQFPWLLGVPDPTIYVVAPAFYLSVLHFTSPNRQVSRRNLLHFVPFLLMTLNEIDFFIEDNATKLAHLKRLESGEILNTPAFIIFLSIIMSYMLIYFVLIFIKLYRHRKNIKLFAASTENIDLNWLRYFLYGVLILFGIWVTGSLFRIDFFFTYSPVGNFIIIYFLGYHAIRQTAIFPFTEQERQEISEIIQDKSQTTIADKRKMFTDAELLELKTQLIQLMKTEKPYLDNELKLPKLAKMMRLNTHEMSYLLNEGFQENFFQFVNQYRIEESKRLLTDPAMYALHSMVGIAFESGFNSKTTFNTTFKKTTGFSPSEYQKMSLEKELV